MFKSTPVGHFKLILALVAAATAGSLGVLGKLKIYKYLNTKIYKYTNNVQIYAVLEYSS